MNTNKQNEIILVQRGTETELINYLNSKPNLLALTYPGPEERNPRAFSEFFESPFRTERRMCSFKGCLAIDLSAYVKSSESSHLEELSSYILSNSDADYVMYAVVDSLDEGVKLIRRMNELTGCRKLCFKNKSSGKSQSEQKRKVYGY